MELVTGAIEVFERELDFFLTWSSSPSFEALRESRPCIPFAAKWPYYVVHELRRPVPAS